MMTRMRYTTLSDLAMVPKGLWDVLKHVLYSSLLLASTLASLKFNRKCSTKDSGKPN